MKSIIVKVTLFLSSLLLLFVVGLKRDLERCKACGLEYRKLSFLGFSISARPEYSVHFDSAIESHVHEYRKVSTSTLFGVKYVAQWREFVLEGYKVRINFRDKKIFNASSDDHGFSISFTPKLSRHTTMLSLGMDGEEKDYNEKIRLKGDLFLEYVISSANVGSGGPEGFFDGKIKFDNRFFYISCWKQEDAFKAYPKWCLPYLKTISISKVR